MRSLLNKQCLLNQFQQKAGHSPDTEMLGFMVQSPAWVTVPLTNPETLITPIAARLKYAAAGAPTMKYRFP